MWSVGTAFVSLPSWRHDFRTSSPTPSVTGMIRPARRILPVARIAVDPKPPHRSSKENESLKRDTNVSALLSAVDAEEVLQKNDEDAVGQVPSETSGYRDGQGTDEDLSWLGSSPIGRAGRIAVVSAIVASAFIAFSGGDDSLQYSIPQELVMPDSRPAFWEEVLADPHFAVSLGLGVSAFVQALTGFGFAIVSVGALSQINWIAHSSIFDDIQPIAATLSGIIAWILVLPEIRKVKWKEIVPLVIASTLCTPIGAEALRYINAGLVLKGLGLLISSYVIYAALDIKVPKILGGKLGAGILGGVAGIFGGAFDISGPPLVIHGQAAGWTENFKRNLLTVIGMNSTVVVACDLFTGRLEDYYYGDFLIHAAPWVFVGMGLGQFVSSKLDPAGFKKIVLATCFVMGLRLLLS